MQRMKKNKSHIKNRTSDTAASLSFTQKMKRVWLKYRLLSRKTNFSARIEAIFAILAFLLVGFTYAAIKKDAGPLTTLEGTTVRTLMLLNLAMLSFLIYAVSRRFIRIFAARRKKAAGSNLQLRFSGAFAIAAIVPAIAMGLFSTFFLETQIQNWFSNTIRQTVTGSQEVAERYMLEHQSVLLKDLTAMELQVATLSDNERSNPFLMDNFVRNSMNNRNLGEVLILQPSFDDAGKVIVQDNIVFARATSSIQLRMQRFPVSMIESVPESGVLIEQYVTDNLMIGVSRLTSYNTPTYLIVTRLLDQTVVQFLDDTRLAAEEYASLEGQTSAILTQFSLAFITVALLLLLIAIWLGLNFANRLIDPLSNLVDAADDIAKGDFTVKVAATHETDEVANLGRAFNRMTEELARQQTDLKNTNDELEIRRRFLEEVLAGVSAGVIGASATGEIYLPNRSACALLGRISTDLIGQSIVTAVPEMKDLIDQASSGEAGMAQGQVDITVHGEDRTLLVRVAEERDNDQPTGMVITFDDLTEQLADQRTAAWADVARRIAHEIKNPLTPIQLSAERLKRKYLKEITTDPKVFSQCTDTIIRQVGDLRNMVDEFSSFARMPAPRFSEQDIVDIIRKAVFLQDVAHNDIAFNVVVKDKTIKPLPLDDRLMGQALTNLIKNATESIETRLTKTAKADFSGKIEVVIKQNETRTKIQIIDNGIGLPRENAEKLLEPYVTTRSKGTGLGLAIVRKIIEDHGGRITLENTQEGGAKITITISHKLLEQKKLNHSNENEN